MDETDPTLTYGNSWFAATKVDASRRPPLGADLDVDVCVIGGGLAGLTTAREVARSGWSVVLVEAGRIAAKASGRNTGFVLPGFAAGPDSIIGRVGFERSKDLWTLAQSGLDYVRNAVSGDGMPGVDPHDGWLYVSKTDNGDDFTRLVGLFGEFGAELEGWPVEQVRAVLRSERYFHAIHFPRAFSIHPLNYALGLAAAAERSGARIFEDTPVLSMDPAGVRKRVVTPNARLRANHVVLCGNIEIAALMRPIGTALIPITTYLITSAPLGPRLAEAIGYRGAVSDSDRADNHYRVVGGDRLMWSGRATTWAREPRRYVRALTADINRTFPQIGKVAVDYVWSGTLGTSIHRMPQIGELAPGVWLASGFGGHGLNTTALAGNLIARAIVDGDRTWQQFTPFELVWAGGIFGRAVAQIHYWMRRMRAELTERRARAVEQAHRARQAEPANSEPELQPPPPDAPVMHQLDPVASPPADPPPTAHVDLEPLAEIEPTVQAEMEPSTGTQPAAEADLPSPTPPVKKRRRRKRREGAKA
jgi:glycine/D-amino acid oxidase-like deaminating enzyme